MQELSNGAQATSHVLSFNLVPLSLRCVVWITIYVSSNIIHSQPHTYMTRVRFPTIVRLGLRACDATPASESTVATSASSVWHCCGVVTRGPQIPIHFVDSVLVSNRLCWIRFCGFKTQDSHFSSRPAIRIHFVHSVLISNRLFGILGLDSIRWILISCVHSDDISVSYRGGVSWYNRTTC